MRMFFFAAILIPTLVYAQDVVEPTPADTCAKVARSPGGKLVRIVGARYNREATPAQDTPLGDVVEVGEDDFTPQSLCHVLIKGIPILDEESGRHVPYQPDLIPFFGKVSWPVQLAGSCRYDGCYWIVLLRAVDCVQAADFDGYVASGMEEIVNLYSGDLDERGRYLWSTGICTDPEAGSHECSVPLSDPTVIAKRDVFVFSSWAGRVDLNFAKAKEGKVQPRVPVEGEIKEIP